LWLATTIEYRSDQREEIQRVKRASFGKLIAQHSDAPWCMDLLQQLALQRSWLETAEVLTLLESFAKQTKNKEAAAQALLKSYGILSGVGNSAEGAQRAGELRERIKQDYADTETGKRLAQDEFRAQHLMPGKPAPEFSAKDVEGVEFKLSDYRGKVVLLSFWGFWCPPCRELIPHERKLVERYQAAPFALVGVNSDSDKEVYKRMAQQEGVTWRSAWEGKRGGELSRLFQVKGYPTLYLIDHQGLVLKSWVGNPGEALLDREIERAVSAARAGEKK
jgi:thiol-disulfide isomerase/thioredoxin